MRTRWTSGAVALLAVWAMPAGVVLAGKPGSGGGGTPPAGTIYAQDLSSVGSGNTFMLLAMDGNGGNRSELMRSASYVRPSRALHGARRWFLTDEIVPGEVHHGVVRRDAFAVREDGALRVRLTSEPTMQYWAFDWAPDEDGAGATIGMLARNWTGTTASDAVVPGSWGFYTAHLSFDAGGDVVGLDANPTFLVHVGTAGDPGRERPDAWTWSWAPDMTRLAVEEWHDGSEPQLRVVDVASGTVTPLGAGEGPDWSPDGSRIAYRRWIDGTKPGFALQTVRPDGSGIATLLHLKQRVGAAQSQYVYSPKWSPDGAHLVYQFVLADNGSSWAHAIHRIAADGTGVTNLTPEVRSGSGLYGLSLVDWR